MSDFIVRPAVSADAEGIAKVHVRTWQYAYKGLMSDKLLDGLSVEKKIVGWKDSLERPKEKTYKLVAEENKKIIGWCIGGISRDLDLASDVGELYAVNIDPDYIGHGVGSVLMRQMLDLLKKDGYKKVTLWVLDGNVKARAFYEKKGWKVEGGKKEDMREGFVLSETRYITTL